MVIHLGSFTILTIRVLNRLGHNTNSLHITAKHGHLKGLICGEHCQVRELDTCRDAQGFAAKAHLSVAQFKMGNTPHPPVALACTSLIWTVTLLMNLRMGTIGHEICHVVFFVSHGSAQTTSKWQLVIVIVRVMVMVIGIVKQEW